MTPTNHPPAALAQVLRAARTLIDKSQEEFICHALSGVAQLYEALEPLAEELQSYVLQEMQVQCERLHRPGTLSTHLLFVVPGWDDGDPDNFPGDWKTLLRQCRLAWLDRMIHELETNECLP